MNDMEDMSFKARFIRMVTTRFARKSTQLKELKLVHMASTTPVVNAGSIIDPKEIDLIEDLEPPMISESIESEAPDLLEEVDANYPKQKASQSSNHSRNESESQEVSS